MGVKNVVKKGLFSGLKVTRWIGIDNIKENGQVISQLAKGLFKQNESENSSQENFEQFMRRMKWSDKDLKQRLKQGSYLVLFCLIAGIAIFFYMFYLLDRGQFLSSFVCLMLSFLLFAHAFREHITSFRLKKRKLDSTVKEWFSNTFMGSK